jgi:predicted MFS family arabinose efflux permease
MGSRVTRDGLPLLAVINLGANSFQMGLLNMVGSLPILLSSLFAGVWVDRLRRRPLLIAADLSRALLLATIPLAALAGQLSMAQLYVVIALAGMLTVLFNTAYQAYIPSLVSREHIVSANSRLALSDSAAEVVGPEVTGVLVQTIGAPLAILLDAGSYLVSVVSLIFIQRPEPAPAAVEERQPVLAEAREGLQAILRQPILRALAAAEGTSSFFGNFIGVLYGLFAIRTLNISPAALGTTIAIGGIGSLLGALLASRAARQFGVGPTLILMTGLNLIFSLLIPIAANFPAQAVILLCLAQIGDAMGTVYSINAVSLRQSITPDRLLGRVNASMELLSAGIGPLGALIGGLLGTLLGIQTTLFIAVIGKALSTLWLYFSPIRNQKNTYNLERQE